MATFQLEGMTGSIRMVMFPEALKQFGTGLQDEMPVMVGGEFKKRDDEPQLMVHEVTRLSDCPEWYADVVRVHMTEAQVSEEKLRALREKLGDFPGRIPLQFCVTFPEGQRVFLASDGEFNVHPSRAFVRMVEHLFGEGCVFVKPRAEVLRFEPPKREFSSKASN
jgi:DNA polymerase III alpha subunit